MSAGRGFRAPSLAEVFSTVDIASVGIRVLPNLELKKAERAISAEIGINQVIQLPRFKNMGILQWLNPKIIADAAMFANVYNNMIDIDYNDSLQAFQFMNLGRARIAGIESKLQLSLFNGHLSAHLGYTWLDHRNTDSLHVRVDQGKQSYWRDALSYRSRHRLVTGGEIHFKRWTLGLDYRYASRHERVVSLYEDDERVPMHVMDARLQADFGKLSVSLECKNLRNYHYTLRQRYLEPVRHYVLTLRGRL